jgi:hypothetical protein
MDLYRPFESKTSALSPVPGRLGLYSAGALAERKRVRELLTQSPRALETDASRRNRRLNGACASSENSSSEKDDLQSKTPQTQLSPWGARRTALPRSLLTISLMAGWRRVYGPNELLWKTGRQENRQRL